MGGSQNDGPFLGPLNTRCRMIFRNQKGTIILTTTHMHQSGPCPRTYWVSAPSLASSGQNLGLDLRRPSKLGLLTCLWASDPTYGWGSLRKASQGHNKWGCELSSNSSYKGSMNLREPFKSIRSTCGGCPPQVIGLPGTVWTDV